MSSRVSRLACLFLLSALAAMAGAAAAQGRGHDRGAGAPQRGAGHRDVAPDSQAAGRHDRRQDQRELSDAVRRVERRTGGQVLSAERVPFDGRDVNRVKVIDSSGRVRVYMDDPQGRRAERPQSAEVAPEGLD